MMFELVWGFFLTELKLSFYSYFNECCGFLNHEWVYILWVLIQQLSKWFYIFLLMWWYYSLHSSWSWHFIIFYIQIQFAYILFRISASIILSQQVHTFSILDIHNWNYQNMPMDISLQRCPTQINFVYYFFGIDCIPWYC